MNASSDARRDANRRNARKSTGPKTEAGKYRSSMNGLKHGIRAERPVIMNAESVDEWVEHRQALLEDLNPVGPIETALAERIVGYFWRIHRVARHEAAVAANSIRNVSHDVPSVLQNHELARSKNEAISAERVRGPLTKLADVYNKWGDSAIKNPSHAKEVDQVRAGFAELREQLLLPDQETAFLITRYEGHLERNLHRTMRELERRQILRLERSGNFEDSTLDPDENLRFEPEGSGYDRRPIVVKQNDHHNSEDAGDLDDDLQTLNNLLAEALKNVNCQKESPIAEGSASESLATQSTLPNVDRPRPPTDREESASLRAPIAREIFNPIDKSFIKSYACESTRSSGSINAEAEGETERPSTIGSVGSSDPGLSDQSHIALPLREEMASLGRSSTTRETPIGERADQALTGRIPLMNEARGVIEVIDDEDEAHEDDENDWEDRDAVELDEQIIKRLSMSASRSPSSHAFIVDRSSLAHPPSPKIEDQRRR